MTQSAPIPKPVPWWVTLAHTAIWEVLGYDLDRWPARDKIKVLCAALDAEPRGECAIEHAAVDCAKQILARRRR